VYRYLFQPNSHRSWQYIIGQQAATSHSSCIRPTNLLHERCAHTIVSYMYDRSHKSSTTANGAHPLPVQYNSTSSTVLSGSASTARQHLQCSCYICHGYHQLFWLTPVKHTYRQLVCISTTSYCQHLSSKLKSAAFIHKKLYQHLPSKLTSAVSFTKILKHIR